MSLLAVIAQVIMLLIFCYIWRFKNDECKHLRTRAEVWEEMCNNKLKYYQTIANRIEEKQNQILDIIKIFKH